MNNQEIIDMLEEITHLIEYSDKAEVIEFISNKKIELYSEQNHASEYMDNLVENLR